MSVCMNYRTLFLNYESVYAKKTFDAVLFLKMASKITIKYIFYNKVLIEKDS